MNDRERLAATAVTRLAKLIADDTDGCPPDCTSVSCPGPSDGCAFKADCFEDWAYAPAELERLYAVEKSYRAILEEAP